jgi:hypothetical protein
MMDKQRMIKVHIFISKIQWFVDRQIDSFVLPGEGDFAKEIVSWQADL